MLADERLVGTAMGRFNRGVTIKPDQFWDAASKAHLRSFKDLVLDRVQRILLVSSLYDSFILSEEGQLQDTLLGQFHDLNLSQVPDLTRVSGGEEAIERLQRPGEFDLVISSVKAGTINAVELTRQLREIGIYVPVLVLAYSNRELTDFMVKHDTSVLDGMFLWQGDARILMAMIKYVEDRHNVAHDTGKFGVPAIIVVEDNVRYYSSFLPVIYTEILQHMQRLLSEDLNMEQRMLRMRARPKVLLCRSYEEAWSYFTRFEQHILGVISDIEFPHDGRLDRAAGLELTSRVHEAHPDVRIVLQ
ncbi:MAG: response regulator, partial [Planctomycetota bacterium]